MPSRALSELSWMLPQYERQAYPTLLIARGEWSRTALSYSRIGSINDRAADSAQVSTTRRETMSGLSFPPSFSCPKSPASRDITKSWLLCQAAHPRRRSSRHRGSRPDSASAPRVTTTRTQQRLQTANQHTSCSAEINIVLTLLLRFNRSPNIFLSRLSAR
ncbi:hypothetical protein N657DRAFT_103296 [Parathielavia appendiculata]|uniref:Uncharacterized protein n=1 Tax=Parathielavia appendiculata TaxID=2587402 RepID=A0AAN6TXN3_9PEZI|nr:hypothetical protein N657DRAFT_103296 [Parathielavia appendiculata]